MSGELAAELRQLLTDWPGGRPRGWETYVNQAISRGNSSAMDDENEQLFTSPYRSFGTPMRNGSGSLQRNTRKSLFHYRGDPTGNEAVTRLVDTEIVVARTIGIEAIMTSRLLAFLLVAAAYLCLFTSVTSAAAIEEPARVGVDTLSAVSDARQENEPRQ